jgi:predicted GNAT family N-acyltransferase
MREPREFKFLSPDYECAWALRKNVLLDPFGIDHAAARTDDERSMHFGIFDGTDCVACLFLVPRSEIQLQMRQVAVATNVQRSGLGSQLLEHSESMAQLRGFTLMSAHARDTAVPFYLKLGYVVRGDPFQQVGIKHYLVEKTLGPTDGV